MKILDLTGVTLGFYNGAYALEEPFPGIRDRIKEIVESGEPAFVKGFTYLISANATPMPHSALVAYGFYNDQADGGGQYNLSMEDGSKFRIVFGSTNDKPDAYTYVTSPR